MNTGYRLLAFWGIAVSSRYYFSYQPVAWYGNIAEPFELVLAKAPLVAIGPFLGALVVIPFMDKPARMSTTGTSVWRSLLMISVPILLFVLFGLPNEKGLAPSYMGLLAALVMVVYVFFEEYGWRGYLQDELRDISPHYRYLIIGTIWYAWHLTFLSPSNVWNEIIFWIVAVAGSWGIGQIANTTYSILACTCFHMIGNIMSRFKLISGGMTLNTRLIILGICLAIWIYLVYTWSKPSSPAT